MRALLPRVSGSQRNLTLAILRLMVKLPPLHINGSRREIDRVSRFLICMIDTCCIGSLASGEKEPFTLHGCRARCCKASRLGENSVGTPELYWSVRLGQQEHTTLDAQKGRLLRPSFVKRLRSEASSGAQERRSSLV